MADKDWYPSNIDARVAWDVSFSTQLPALAAKHDISAGDGTQAGSDPMRMSFGCRCGTTLTMGGSS